MNTRFTSFQEDTKENFREINTRFTSFQEDTKENFREINTRFTSFQEDTKNNFIEIKYDLRMDKEKLDKVYESRDQVTVKFSRAFTGINVVFAALVAFFVSFWR